MSDNPNQVIELSDVEKNLVVEKKATCPFIGSAIAQGDLAVRNAARDPLASIEDVRLLGNSGGGDLGDFLVMFAAGNHAFMRGDAGKLDKLAPDGLFSLEFPGSQGSHPGHSGILQGDPETLDSGRLSEADFNRLLSRARDGAIKRSDVGHFIAENLIKDPRSKVADLNTAELLAGDVVNLVETAGSALVNKLFGSGKKEATTHREVEEKLTKLGGENNLVGSAGEFGLLFAFVANKPGARKVDGEPSVEVSDLKTMFLDKRLPDGWETWKKNRVDWVKNTTGLLLSAAKEYHRLKGR
ncbi:MAG: hypothetical protein ACXW18_10385 [Pyrinomonadaceae bacterium]